MSPSIFAVVLHLGSIIQTFKDVEQGVSDIISGKANPADGQAVLADVAALLGSGLINIPGFTPDQLTAVVAQIKAAL